MSQRAKLTLALLIALPLLLLASSITFNSDVTINGNVQVNGDLVGPQVLYVAESGARFSSVQAAIDSVPAENQLIGVGNDTGFRR